MNDSDTRSRAAETRSSAWRAVEQVVRQLPGADRHRPVGAHRRAHRDLRAVGLGQVDADPLHQPARDGAEGPHRRRRHRPHGRRKRNVDAVRREVGMVFQQFNLFPHLTILQNCTLAPMRSRGMSKEEAEATAMKYLDARAHSRAGQQVPEPAFGRPAAARRDRARAVHDAQDHAVRRADLGARPGDGQGSARHDDRPGRGRHDHAVRDARDGLRAQRGRPRDLHGRRPHRRAGAAGASSSATRRTRRRASSSGRSSARTSAPRRPRSH